MLGLSTVVAGVVAGVVGAAAMLALAPSSSAPRPRSSKADRQIDRPNVVAAGAVVEVPHSGVTLAYERAVHPAFSLRVDLEHIVSPRGFSHIPGLSPSVALAVWPLRALQGPYFAAGGGVGTNHWSRRPSISDVTGFADIAAGYRFSFPIGLSLGASVGLRYGFLLEDDPRLCTHEDICRNARSGPQARIVIDVGWRFGRRSDSPPPSRSSRSRSPSRRVASSRR